MHKCKNIGCNNEILKGIYCNLTCRNIYVNKYERDYSKYKETIANKESTRRKTYFENPKKCNQCYKSIEYDKRRNKFCSRSCSAIHTNLTRDKITYNNSNILKKFRLINLHRKITYKGNPSHCIKCKSNITYENTSKVYCSKECREKLKNYLEINSLSEYRSRCKFKFSLNEYPDYFEFNLIEKYGWYSPSNSKSPNLNGVSRDHIFSVSEGLKQNIDPEIISHPANCRLIPHSDNISKLGKCDISLEDLISKINTWGCSLAD